MKLGVRAHDMGRGSLQRMLDGVAAHKFSCVQLTMTDLFDDFPVERLTDALALQFREAFEARGISIAVLSCYINPIHPDATQRAAALDTFFRYQDFAKALGCDTVATETGSFNPDFSEHPDNHTQRGMDALTESLERMVRHARDLGQRVAIEGVTRFVAHDVPSMRAILQRFPGDGLRAIFDPVNLLDAGNSARQTQIIQSAFEQFADRIVAVHLKDFTVDENALTAVPVGTGLLDLKTLLPLCARRDLPIILEEQSPLTVEASIARINAIA